ncbi:uncharacterized protein LOC106647269 [Copidosoma floridanum]|uniref:uncharacterized protein LOC106647269 n=1 Tax=Copidosoma floridanum TaxID=29053 RepID=UPI000C6F6D99|nr:uncharacterized protein LOC106647269 [Copidosoma floridanum]
MEKKCFVWDDTIEGLALARTTKDDDKKKVSRRKSKAAKSKIYFPHKHLLYNFKETLSFTEQTKFQKYYERKKPSVQATSDETNDWEEDVVLLQDVKNLTLYLIGSPVSPELTKYLQVCCERFLRALVLYFQHYLTTWTGLSEKRAAAARRIPNPLAGGARQRRAEEMKVLRCVLACEYAELLMGRQEEAKPYHHLRAGETAFAQSCGEKDLRVYETLLQFGHRLVWIALGRKQKELIEVEMHRLFRSDAFNSAKRRCTECQVPEDERWILYGPRLPARRKILSNSPLPYEILNPNCDHRLLSIGNGRDPRVVYLENALLAREQDLPRLGIKLGILGMPRSDFDVMLIPQASEEDHVVVDEAAGADKKEADDYESLIPASGLDQ